eukprot:3091082-Prymnesium_polylepis.1
MEQALAAELAAKLASQQHLRRAGGSDEERTAGMEGGRTSSSAHKPTAAACSASSMARSSSALASNGVGLGAASGERTVCAPSPSLEEVPSNAAAFHEAEGEAECELLGELAPIARDGDDEAVYSPAMLDEPAESSIGGQTTCIICMCEPKTHAAVPCGH